MTDKPPQSLVRFVYSDAVLRALGGRYRWTSSGDISSLPPSHQHNPQPVPATVQADGKTGKKVHNQVVGCKEITLDYEIAHLSRIYTDIIESSEAAAAASARLQNLKQSPMIVQDMNQTNEAINYIRHLKHEDKSNKVPDRRKVHNNDTRQKKELKIMTESSSDDVINLHELQEKKLKTKKVHNV